MTDDRTAVSPFALQLARLSAALARTLAIGALAGAAVGWFVSRGFDVELTPGRSFAFLFIGAIYALALGGTERIMVTDNGPGFECTDVETLLSRGTGLANARDRLRLLFGDAAELRILSDGVEIAVPFTPVAERAAAPAAAPTVQPARQGSAP